MDYGACNRTQFLINSKAHVCFLCIHIKFVFFFSSQRPLAACTLCVTSAQSRNVVLDTFENALAKLLCNYIVNWNHGART